MRQIIIPLISLIPLYSYSNVLITEVMYDSPGNDSLQEWVELTNTGCTEQSLDGWTLSDNSSHYSLSGTILPSESLTIARSTEGFYDLYQKYPDRDDLSLQLGNSGDYLKLNNNNVNVDLVAWENKISGWPINARNRPIERNNSNDTDNVSDWQVNTHIGNPNEFSYLNNNECSPTEEPIPDDYIETPEESSEPSNFNFYEYYDAALNLTGQSLKQALATISAQGHNRMTYSQVWDALKYTDEDPDNSNNVILFYSQRSQLKEFTAGNSNDQDAWNREHIWPKSLGFKNSNQWGYTDIHALRPSDVSINSARSNKVYDNSTDALSESPENRFEQDSFEPRDSMKGDAARMIFYLATRYEGNDSNNTNMPDLTLINSRNSRTGVAKFGVLCTLVEWSNQDAVDTWEQRRHERAVERQGNRNPFIDNPQWVNELYANKCQ